MKGKLGIVSIHTIGIRAGQLKQQGAVAERTVTLYLRMCEEEGGRVDGGRSLSCRGYFQGRIAVLGSIAFGHPVGAIVTTLILNSSSGRNDNRTQTLNTYRTAVRPYGRFIDLKANLDFV